MALTEDVGSEVRRILTNNTVDQCIQYNQSIKRDILGAQEELRDVIGQRYRELLQACDRVVGMEAICSSIEASYQSSMDKHRSRPSVAQGAGGTTASATATASLSTAVIAQQPASTAALQDIIRLTECEETLRSARGLMVRGAYAGTAKSFRQFVGLLEDLQEDGPLALPSSRASLVALGVSAQCLQRDIKNHMVRTLANVGTEPGRLINATGVLADMHAACELMDACSPSAALGALMDVHDAALDHMLRGTTNEAEAIATAQRVQNHVVHLAWYLAQVAGNQVAVDDDSQLAVPMHMDALARVDASAMAPGSYRKLLQLQLCGHQAGGAANRRFASRPAACGPVAGGGWALSPPQTAAPIAVPQDTYRRIEAHALTVLHRALREHVTTSRSLAKVETLLLGAAQESAKARLLATPHVLLDVAQWESAVRTSIAEALQQAIALALGQAEKGLGASIDAAVAGKTTSAGAAAAASRGGGGKRQDGGASSVANIVGTILRSNGYGSPAGGSSTTRPGTSPVSQHAPAGFEASQDDFQGGLEHLKTILAVAVERGAGGVEATHNSNGNSNSTSANTKSIGANVVALLVQSIGRMVDTLQSRTKETFQAARNASIDAAAIALSAICSTLMAALTDVRGQLAAADADRLAPFAVSLQALYESCHTGWLLDVSRLFGERIAQAYRPLLVPLAKSSSSSVSGREGGLPQSSVQVRAALGNVWLTQAVEDTTNVAFPISFAPGVGRAVFEAQQQLHARRAQCGGLLAPLMARRFGEALCAQHLTVVKRMLNDAIGAPVTGSNASSTGTADGDGGMGGTVCEETAFQLFFDVQLIFRMLLPPSQAGPTNQQNQQESELARNKQILLRSLEEQHIDVVNFSVAQPLVQKAVEAAAMQSALSMGLGTNANPPSSSVAVAPTAQHMSCSIALEDEADRLPLLPITTPTQVRNIVVSSLNGKGGGVAVVGGDDKLGVGSQRTGGAAGTASSASSLWSATSKLRSVAAFWGQ